MCLAACGDGVDAGAASVQVRAAVAAATLTISVVVRINGCSSHGRLTA
jgi:hypothetical protein